MNSKRSDAGVGLIEIMMAILVLGGAIAALLASLSTAVSASQTQRHLVETDTVLRNYAEATKRAVREQCTGSSGGSYSVTYSASGFTFSAAPASTTCPAATATTELTLTATRSASATTDSLVILVRRP